MDSIQERMLRRYKKASTTLLIAEQKAVESNFSEKSKLEVREARGYSRAMREACYTANCSLVLVENAYFEGLQDYRKQYPSEKAPTAEL